MGLARKAWMVMGFALYLIIAFFLPITVPLLGIYTDQPITYPRLLIPLFVVPFGLGYFQRYFPIPWRLHLWCPAVILLGLMTFAIVEDFSKREYLVYDLIFWPLMIACYLGFSYLGKRSSDSAST